MREFFINEKGQAQANPSIKITDKDFNNNNHVSVYWLGGGGVMINSYGTTIMIDPLLEGFDMPLLVESVANPKEIKHIDGVLVSHVDNDHYSRPTLKDMKDAIDEVHTSYYVAGLMKDECDIQDAIGHTWLDEIQIKNVKIKFLPADHNWQNAVAKYQYRTWEKEEYFGFLLETEGKKIWYVGDSRLMDYQLKIDEPDVILFDFADNPVHIGLENAYKLANTYPNAKLLLIHWGCVDAPTSSAFNGNPQNIIDNIKNPERVIVAPPGFEYIVK